jgi:hypothetical protein
MTAHDVIPYLRGFVVLLVVALVLFFAWRVWPDVKLHVMQSLRKRKLEEYFNGSKRPPPGQQRSVEELVELGNLWAEYRRGGTPYDPEKRRVVIEAAKADGYHTMLDHVTIRRDGGAAGLDRLVVQSEGAPYLHHLVKDFYEDDPVGPGRKKLVRIDIHRNDKARTLVHSLGDIVRIDDKCESSRGLSRLAVRGVALTGKRKGERQEWMLDYYP